MRRVELFTGDGHFVAVVEISLPDRGLPEVVMWGDRTFSKKTHGGSSLPRFEEAFAVVSFTPSPGLTREETPPVDRSARAVLGTAVAPGEADTTDRGDGQQKGYVVLSAEERAKGFVRPVRRTYKHTKCGGVTTMSQPLAETYARDPAFYSGTFCTSCGAHFPVGVDGEFSWADDGQKVGT